MKTKPDKFAAISQIFQILKDFDEQSRSIIVSTVEDKILANAPKKRVRKTKSLLASVALPESGPGSLQYDINNARKIGT